MNSDSLLQRAAVLTEALPYLQKFRDQTVVIKYGGSAMEDATLVEHVLRDVVLLEVVGINPVIVHGGGKAITARMAAAGLRAVFKGGQRVTDAASLGIVVDVLDGETNPAIVDGLKSHGGRAHGISGRGVLLASKAPPVVLPDGSVEDLGFIGEIDAVRAGPLRDCVAEGVVPVVSPVGADAAGQMYNINADIAAREVAVALKAARLVYLSDVPGILRDPKDESSLIPSISEADIARLKAEGVLSGGMLPKVDSALSALRRGVGKVQFIDGRVPHSLLLELFTDSGIGTEIVL
jgi:acetylglutamate kinase